MLVIDASLTLSWHFEDERTPAKRIAHGDQLAFAHDQDRESTLDPTQSAQHAATIARGLSEEVQNDFAVSCGLKD